MATDFGATNVRPMQIGEILDGTFNIYRRHFGLFMRLSFVLICVPAVLAVYAFARLLSDPMGFPVWLGQNLLTAISLGLVAVLIWALVSVLLKAGTVKIISDSYLGHEPSLGNALRFGASRILPMLLVALSKGVLLMVMYFAGILAFMVLVGIGRALGGAAGAAWAGTVGVLGGIWAFAFVLCGYALTTMVIVLEDLDSTFEAFPRSWGLTQGAKLKVFLVWLVMWLITYLVPTVAVLGLRFAVGLQSPLQPVLSILSPIISVILAPLAACALTLVYYDLRVRREAFDLQILSEQLETR
ncbi:MAG TPA: hypothetical protein VFM23_08000 [Gemmatimonadales bacterium]|jgi:hypothetical protein|nr:hypothetical protein [Gemmatimonadales bacterium]